MFSLRFAACAAGAGLFAFVAIGAASIASAAPPATSVAIDNFMFSPMTVTVPVGGTVAWTNNDDIPHSVRSVDGTFHSPALDTGEHYSFAFTKPGVYSYFCGIHPKMVAKVIVQAR